jgi:hypothetical protein
LDCLNAEYDRYLASDISFGNIVVPPDLQIRMTAYGQADQVEIDIIANELEKVNDTNEITIDFEFDNSQALSFFGVAFDNLQDILRKTPKHFSLEVTLPDTLKTPPLQTTIPTSSQTPPTYAVDTTNPPPSITSSISSSESYYETNTHMYAYHFLWAIMESLKHSLKKFT